MAMIPPHIVDDIMQTSRIEEVIGEFVQLKRAGANLKGLSPFTDEKTPSFVVSPGKQIFKCFSTGKGGSVVTFLMEKEHYSYPEALKWLADKYNITVPEDEPATPEQLAEISERESLYVINSFAKDHFKDNLHNNPEGKRIGLSYFVERGFRPDIIEKFELGYCLNKSDGFTSAALDKQYKLEYLEKVGLTKIKDDRKFDFFRGRVLFPIHSISGRVLGFGGRTLQNDKKIAKYYNSPESLIYHKSDILYGLYFAKNDIIKYDMCYLCEGYTDVISMYQAGVQNVVASSGTSLTKEQVRLIKRYTKNITILYDGDAAGIKASFRGIDLILEEGLNVKVILFPEGEDPDSYSKSVSASELENYLKEKSQNFISFKADLLLEGSENDPIQRAGLIKQIVGSVALIPDSITRNVFIKSIAERFDMTEEVLMNELISIRNSKKGKAISNSSKFSPPQEPPPEFQEQLYAPQEKSIPSNQPKVLISSKNLYITEREVIRMLVKYGSNVIKVMIPNEHGKLEEHEISVAENIIHDLSNDELTITDPLLNKIYTSYAESLAENSFLTSDSFKSSENQDIVRLITEFEFEDIELSHNWVTKYKIFTPHELDKLNIVIPKTIGNFKLAHIEMQLEKLQEEKHDDIEFTNLMLILAEEKELQQIRLQLNQMLGKA